MRYAPQQTRARPDIQLAAPRVNRPLLAIIRVLSGLYLRLALGCRTVQVLQPRVLVDAFRRALSGQARVIVAFRHPFVDEPQILTWLFTRGVGREARSLRERLPRRSHALFVHGYEVPRWSGRVVRALLPRMGALPIHHARMDSAGMARIRQAITDGDYPLALAPEGQVSYTSEAVPRLEPGAVRLGFEAAAALARAGRSEPVLLLPLSVHRRFDRRRAQKSMERVLCDTERFLGLAQTDRQRSAERMQGPAQAAPREPAAAQGVHARLDRAVEHLVARAEAFYRLQPAAVAGVGDATPAAVLEAESEARADGNRDARLAAVIEAAVHTGERWLGLSTGGGDTIERVYRIRQAGWDRIYVRDDPRRQAPLDRALADRLAGEAWYAMRHMELADFAWYFRTRVPDPEEPLHLLVEYVQNVWDFANRLAGGAISGRRTVRPYRTVIVAGRPLDLSARLAQYRSARRAAVADAQQVLRRQFEACIDESRRAD